MTAVAHAAPAVDAAERGLMVRVLDALLREDHAELSTAGAPVTGPGPGPLRPGRRWWGAPLHGGRRVALVLGAGGFLSDERVVEPLLVLDGPDGRSAVTTLDAALAALAPAGDPEAQIGWADFVEECAQTLATLRLHGMAGPELYARLAAEGAAAGFEGMLQHDAVAALRDHPVHPTGRCRRDLDEAQLRRYAPEFRPEFALRWAVVPRAELLLSPALAADGLPAWWPLPSALGAAPARDADHLAMPVHPLTAERGDRSTVPAGPQVTPTLSTRTVALRGEPGVHLKLPLPTATLGRRNRRSIAAGTLADGDTVQRLLAAVLRREPRLRSTVLLADESHWIEGADEMLAVLVRRYPPELAADRLVPLAALLAPDPHAPGATMLAGLAAGDVPAFLDRYLAVLLDWHVALWLRYGVALESHQQNVTVAIAPAGGLRLVYKDDDGARIDCTRLAAALGQDAPFPVEPAAFHDGRIAVTDPVELADMFVTITLHLCAGALVVEHAGADGDLAARLLATARDRLCEAARRWCDPADAGSLAAADLLRRHVLDADRWPVKAMVTAGTLLPKHRLGCTDINKHYRRSGPNYLRTAHGVHRENRSRS